MSRSKYVPVSKYAELPEDAVGLYGYYQHSSEKLIYIGLDKNLFTGNHKRHREHLQPSQKNKQEINKYLQRNREFEGKKWDYIVLGKLSPLIADAVEQALIDKIKPMFNFDEGGRDDYHRE